MRDKINSIAKECIKLPAMVKAELLVGAFKSVKPLQGLSEVLEFCRPYEIVPFDDSMTETYGRTKAVLERTGRKIGFNDTIIASTVLARNGILVTNNVKEFSRVEELIIEDWTQE